MKMISRGCSSTVKRKVQFPQLPEALKEKYRPGEMFRYRDSIASLPVPPLRQTLSKYLLSVEPLLSCEEMKRTRKIVEEFGVVGGVGEQLQKQLEKRAKTHDNWLIDWWNQVAYLSFREPVMVNVSPAVGYPKQPSSSLEEVARTAASFVVCNAKIAQLVYNEAIPPDMVRRRPMCMSQYEKLRGTRIPREKVDAVHVNNIVNNRHIAVIRKGHIFKLDIFYDTPEGEVALAPPTHIMSELYKILSETTEKCPHPVGVLTTEHRDTWYQARKKLTQDPANNSSLQVIDDALFVMCLDDPHPHVSSGTSGAPFNDSQCTMVSNRCLHGNGTQFNTCNRWFDATSQLVMGDDGGAGTILEHSAADGQAGILTNMFTLDVMYTNKYDIMSEASPVEASSLRPAEKLEWNISPDIAKYIDTAKVNADRLVQNTDLRVFRFTEFGKDFVKSMKLSPDGFFQNAILLAYYKLYNRPSAMYESGSTRLFKYARTDTIRSCTSAALAFVKSMTDPMATAKFKAKNLAEAISAHSHYVTDAIMGQAVDRHLLGLRMLAVEAGMEVPEIFTDVAYTRSTYFCLSTSQVPAVHDIYLCFGAVVPDGYGVCYNPQSNQFILSVSSFRDCPETDSLLFGSKLVESLLEMREVLVENKSLTSKL